MTVTRHAREQFRSRIADVPDPAAVILAELRDH